MLFVHIYNLDGKMGHILININRIEKYVFKYCIYIVLIMKLNKMKIIFSKYNKLITSKV